MKMILEWQCAIFINGICTASHCCRRGKFHSIVFYFHFVIPEEVARNNQREQDEDGNVSAH